MILEVNGVSKKFGQLAALAEVDLQLGAGEILGVAGPNGAGKSTLFNVIAGYFPPSHGRILFQGRDITALGSHKVCHLGLARTFQIPQVFTSLSVYDNVRVGATFGSGYRVKPRQRIVQEVLELVGLKAFSQTRASNLDLYTTKLVMLAAALATDCRVLLLDEPLGGLSIEEMSRFLALVQKLNQELGLSIIIIEHLLDHLIEISHRMVILHNGSVIYNGTPEGIRRDRKVIEVYLGEGAHLSPKRPSFDRPAKTNGTPLLEIEKLNSFYGEIQVLNDVCLTVAPGETVALFGPNGHGKSTLLKAIAGIHPPRSGSIKFKGRELGGLGRHIIVAAGLTYISESRNLFPEMTVLENLRLGAYTGRARAELNANLELVLDLFPRLAERRGQVASTLSGGEARMLAIARGLMSGAELLLVDEPSIGLSPLMKEAVFSAIAQIRQERGVSILVVEQEVAYPLALADRVYLLKKKQIVLERQAGAINRQEIERAYF
jgi:ABC-type branched-subunit amino acid transport system ATPase component